MWNQHVESTCETRDPIDFCPPGHHRNLNPQAFYTVEKDADLYLTRLG